jgi:glycosyltransferase involved in cell wall biosynthesis
LTDNGHVTTDVCIAICTRNRAGSVRVAVESALANIDAEVILVDQNPDERVVEALSGLLHRDRLRHLRTTTVGAGKARNLAVASTDAEIICFTDDDCELTSDWARRLTDEMAADQTLGLAFCAVNEAPSRGSVGYAPMHEIPRKAVFTEISPTLKPEKLGIGAGMAIRREAVVAIGGFDPEMGPGSRFPSADDREVALRLLMNGWSVADLPGLDVVHHGHRAAGRELRALTKRDFIALGAMMAKVARSDTPGRLPHIVRFMRRVVADAIKDSRKERRLSGFGKPLWAAVGLARGLRPPIDHERLISTSHPEKSS